MKLALENSNRDFFYFRDEKGRKKKLFFNKKFNIYMGKDSISEEHSDCWELVKKEDEIFYFQEVIPEVTEDNYLKIKGEFLHRMIVFAFGDKNKKYQYNFDHITEIDHVDGNKMRNIPENLEIVDPIINQFRAYKHNYDGAKDRFFNTLSNLPLSQFERATKILYKEMEG